MWSWSGLGGDLHLTYLSRKPKPLGWMLKTSCCAITGVYINAELTMKRQRMDLLPYVSELSATCACTPRLVEPWFHSRRIVVGDSWFGSVRTCLELMRKGLFSVFAIKTGHKNFPKQTLIDRVGQRFAFSCMFRSFSVGSDCTNLIASAWKDKKDMLVVASCMDDKPTPQVERLRSRFKDGRVQKIRYNVEQRRVHAFYREHFHGIDLLNRLALGPGTVADGWRPHNGVQDELKQVFLYTLAMIETNAFRCYTYFTGHDVSRSECKILLADALMDMGHRQMRPDQAPLTGRSIPFGMMSNHGSFNPGQRQPMHPLEPQTVGGQWKKRRRDRHPITKAFTLPNPNYDQENARAKRATCMLCGKQTRCV